jgi:hypothetical protein
MECGDGRLLQQQAKGRGEVEARPEGRRLLGCPAERPPGLEGRDEDTAGGRDLDDLHLQPRAQHQRRLGDIRNHRREIPHTLVRGPQGDHRKARRQHRQRRVQGEAEPWQAALVGKLGGERALTHRAHVRGVAGHGPQVFEPRHVRQIGQARGRDKAGDESRKVGAVAGQHRRTGRMGADMDGRHRPKKASPTSSWVTTKLLARASTRATSTLFRYTWKRRAGLEPFQATRPAGQGSSGSRRARAKSCRVLMAP